MIATRCLLCGRKEAPKELYPATFQAAHLTGTTYSARRTPDRVHYRIVRCTRCGLVYSNPILPPGKIADLYKGSTQTYDAIRTYVAATYVKLVERYRLYLPSNPQVLEIGCGTGFFLESLRKRFGWTKLSGVEPGTDMVAHAPKWLKKTIRTDIFKPGQFRRDSMDLVCCFHTLDHMTDPVAMLTESYRVIRPGGLLLIVTHDTDNPSVKLMGEKSPIFDIEHIYLFNRQTLGVLAAKAGFSVVTSERLTNTYPLWYWLAMSSIPGSLASFANGVCALFGISRTPVSFAGGNLFMALRKPITVARPRRIRRRAHRMTS